MKLNLKTILTLMLFSSYTISYTQDVFEMKSIEVTEGQNAQKGTFVYLEDVTVIEAPSKSQEELYNLSINWLNETYKNPDEVLKGKIEGEYIRWTGIAPSLVCENILLTPVCRNLRYTIEIRFKEGRVRWEFTNLELYYDASQYSAGGWYPWLGKFRVVNHKGKTNSNNAASARNYRSYMNNLANSFRDYLLKENSENGTDDDW